MGEAFPKDISDEVSLPKTDKQLPKFKSKETNSSTENAPQTVNEASPKKLHRWQISRRGSAPVSSGKQIKTVTPVAQPPEEREH